MTLTPEAAEENLRDYLLDGIASEIFRADQAYSLGEHIGQFAEEINAANFGELFGSLQIVLSDRQTLSVVIIFEPTKRYPTRSIPSVLGLLQSEAETWRVPEPGKLRRGLVNSGSDSTSVEQMNNTELRYAICCYFRSTLPNTKRLEPGNLSHALDALRQSRDKVIAHNEAIDSASFQPPTWGDATSLLNYAK